MQLNLFKKILLFITLAFVSLTPKDAFAINGANFVENKDLDFLEQEEKILSYESFIKVNKNNSLEVIEKIKVVSKNYEIKHGIYRDFPTIYNWKYGLKKKVSFKIKEVQKNGRNEEYFTENVTNGVRVYIGDKNEIINPGIYTYTLKYQTDKQIGDFEDFDELNFNIVGPGWSFPIDVVEAKIELPFVVENKDLKLDGFTGVQNSTEKNLTLNSTIQDGKTIISIKSTKQLDSYEGLTVVVAWPNGFIDFPSSDKGFLRIIKDNPEIPLGVFFSILLLFVYMLNWYKHGIDPKKKVVIPLYEAPRGMSPATIRFLKTEKADNKSVVASIINLGVQGILTIEEKAKQGFLSSKTYYTLTRKSENISEYQEEKLLLDEQFSQLNSQKDIGIEYDAGFGKTITKYKNVFNSKFKEKYFINNIKFSCFGVFISLIFAFVTGIFIRWNDLFVTSLVSGVFLSIGFVVLVSAFTGEDSAWNKFMGTCFGIFWLIVAVVASFFIAKNFGSIYLSTAVVIQVILHAIFYYLLKSPTKEGAELLTEIDGFKMFLSVTEEEDIKLMFQKIPQTLDTFQKYLPYAVALDVETLWTRKFENLIMEAQVDGSNNALSWYTGASIGNFASSGISSFSSGLSSSVASSAQAPGSSSGGSGGSGGGGGGGGGGGW